MLDLNHVRRQAKDKEQLSKWNEEGLVDVEGGRLKVELNLPRRFESRFIWTQRDWVSSEYCDDRYVWFHVDDTGDPFYAGIGRGAVTWECACGPAWEWFIRERLGGAYQIAILATGLSEENAVLLLDQVYSAYEALLLNLANIHRAVNYEGLKDYRSTKDLLSPYYNRISAASASERLTLSVEAQQLQYRLAKCMTETGRLGEVLRDMGGHGGVNQFFIPFVIEGLLEGGQPEEARAALAEYLQYAPNAAQAKKIARLQQMVNRGTFKRRGTRKQS